MEKSGNKSKMTSVRTLAAAATAVLMLTTAVPQCTGQSSPSIPVCQQQCYQNYLRLYDYYCDWGELCQYTDYLGQVHMACYENCGNLATTTSKMTTPPGPVSQTAGQSCGQSMAPGLTNQAVRARIINGTMANECEFPWTVVVSSANTFCGGSILNSNTVLTAGHCIYNTLGGVTRPGAFTVKYGSSNQQRTKIAYVTKVLLHPDFVLSYYDNDVALLTLDRNLLFDSCTQPICLPSPGSDPSKMDSCQAAGWGALAYNKPTSQTDLYKVTLPVVSLSDCQRAYNDNRLISDIKLCAGNLKDGGIDSCLGDSGGPFMCNSRGLYYLYGVVSFGRGCATPGYPGVYANVANPSISSWIRNNM